MEAGGKTGKLQTDTDLEHVIFISVFFSLRFQIFFLFVKIT